MDANTTRRRWTPVTENTVIDDMREAADDAVTFKPWPRGWWFWRQVTADIDLAVIRKTRETTR